MPPRPFPFPLNLGIDICHTRRIADLVFKDPGKTERVKLFSRFLTKFLTWREQQDFWRFADGKMVNVLSGERHAEVITSKSLKWLAARWAAKEAVIKAVHYRKLGFMHIQILRSRPDQAGTGPLHALILDKPASAFGKPHRTTDAEHSKHHPDDATAIQVEPLEDGASAGESGEGGGADSGKSAGRKASRYGDDDFTPAELQNDELDGQVARISLSHDGEYVTAVCLAVEDPAAGDVGGEAAARGL